MSTKGIKYSAESRARMSAAQKGNKNGFKPGHLVSPEIRAKISAANKGRGHKQTEETRNKISASMMGHRNSPEAYEKMAEAQRGEKNRFWKGGKTTIHGYVYLKRPNHPFSSQRGYVAEHRLVMEKILDRFLKPEEVVHHINEIPSDNREENLMLLSNVGEHSKLHMNQEKQL